MTKEIEELLRRLADQCRYEDVIVKLPNNQVWAVRKDLDGSYNWMRLSYLEGGTLTTKAA